VAAHSGSRLGAIRFDALPTSVASVVCWYGVCIPDVVGDHDLAVFVDLNTVEYPVSVLGFVPS
jgi:hypothetical protein